VIKSLSTIFIFAIVGLSLFTPKSILATCTCESINNVNTLISNNCAADEVPNMYINANAASGCRCACGGITARRLETVLCADEVSVNTALGCVPVEMDKFIAWLLPYIFGIGGGIAFILMIYGFILMTTSNGDPKAVQGAKETVTSALIGLLICIFAIFLLRLITVDILKIPGIS
jgi:hypothetical protein